jgi:hypothetical protein
MFVLLILNFQKMLLLFDAFYTNMKDFVNDLNINVNYVERVSENLQ